VTTAALATSPPAAPISSRKRRIDVKATTAFRRPKRSEVRKRPRFGTKTRGKRSEAARAPR